MKVIFSLPKEERTAKESELAIQGYDSLRSAIELLVEDNIFKKTVKRYKRNISMGMFETIDGAYIDEVKERLNTIFEQACGYIEPHSNPEEEAEPPTLQQLKDDFDEISAIYDRVK